MSTRSVVLDTNILLETPEIIEERTDVKFVIPYTVLKELDSLKRKRHELGLAVRVAARTILRNRQNIEFDVEKDVPSINDEAILSSASRLEAELYTEDILMTLLAESYGVPVFNPVQNLTSEYSGYYELTVTEDMDDLVQSYFSRSATTTRGFERDVLEKYLPSTPSPTEFVVLMHGGTYNIFKLSVDDDYYVRLSYKHKKLRVNGSGVELQPLDAYQHMALLSACDLSVPMTIIDGAMGSGKTLVALASALYLHQEHKLKNIYVTRAPLGIDQRYEVGYLKGDLNEKLSPWVGGIKSNLSFFYKHGADEVFEDKFKHFPVNSAQGYSIHDSVLIVDEAQLLSIDVLKQVISRVADDSKLIVIGDEDQQYNVVPRAESGFRKLKKLLPNKDLEYVRLRNIYRGPLAKLALEL